MANTTMYTIAKSNLIMTYAHKVIIKVICIFELQNNHIY